MQSKQKIFKEVEGLLEREVTPNLVDEKTGNTLLYIAVEKSNFEIVKLLLDKKAETFRVNRELFQSIAKGFPLYMVRSVNRIKRG